MSAGLLHMIFDRRNLLNSNVEILIDKKISKKKSQRNTSLENYFFVN